MMKSQQLYTGFFCVIVLFLLYRVVKLQYEQARMEAAESLHPFDSEMEDFPASDATTLPHGIVEARSDMELKPLWSSDLKTTSQDHKYLLAIPVGIKQKWSVNIIIQKFIPENFSIILFHYDGNVNGWDDLEWSSRTIHIVAHNQTKWWFAKRFLHPDVVSLYEYIFLWDEDLGVENFDPGRYLDIVKSEGLEISQPALDPDLSSEIHHSITIRRSKKIFHKRIRSKKWNSKCSNLTEEEPPCTGWVEGMVPVFSRSAWHCVWNLIQNDLIHGWGIDMKLGHCAKGDPRKRVGVVDSEYVVHQGLPTLGGSSEQKAKSIKYKSFVKDAKVHARKAVDVRVASRKQAKQELQIFQDRWEQAKREDKHWINPFNRPQRQHGHTQPRKRSTVHRE